MRPQNGKLFPAIMATSQVILKTAELLIKKTASTQHCKKKKKKTLKDSEVTLMELTVMLPLYHPLKSSYHQRETEGVDG